MSAGNIRDKFFLRLFIEEKIPLHATDFAYNLTEKLTPLCKPNLIKVERYWKIPEYFEICIELLDPEKIEKIISLLGEGWLFTGGCYIFDDTSGLSFITDEIRWACIDFLDI